MIERGSEEVTEGKKECFCDLSLNPVCSKDSAHRFPQPRKCYSEHCNDVILSLWVLRVIDGVRHGGEGGLPGGRQAR